MGKKDRKNYELKENVVENAEIIKEIKVEDVLEPVPETTSGLYTLLIFLLRKRLKSKKSRKRVSLQ